MLKVWQEHEYLYNDNTLKIWTIPRFLFWAIYLHIGASFITFFNWVKSFLFQGSVDFEDYFDTKKKIKNGHNVS